MSNIKAAIKGVCGWVPEDILTNQMLEEMVDTNDEWIVSRTGIKERRILKLPNTGTSYMGTKAVKGLIEKTGIDPKEIDLILCATATPDMRFPATANFIASNVGATNSFSYDMSAACSGFLYALSAGAQYIKSGQYKKVVVVGADKMSSIVNYEDRSSCIIFGDGAGAVLLEPDTENGYVGEYHRTDAAGAEFLNLKAGGSKYPASIETVQNKEHFLFQDGRPVFKAAVNGMSDAIQNVLTENNVSANELAWIVPHQANIRIISAIANKLDFPMEKVAVCIEKYGNTTAATIPLCFWEFEDQFKKGDKIVLTAFGGGFTWGASLLTWAY